MHCAYVDDKASDLHNKLPISVTHSQVPSTTSMATTACCVLAKQKNSRCTWLCTVLHLLVIESKINASFHANIASFPFRAMEYICLWYMLQCTAYGRTLHQLPPVQGSRPLHWQNMPAEEEFVSTRAHLNASYVRFPQEAAITSAYSVLASQCVEESAPQCN